MQRAGDGEYRVLVRDPLFDAACSADIFCEELEWTCDCGGELDPCPHIAAALHWLERLRTQPAELATPDLVQTAPSTPSTTAHIEYVFARLGQSLTFARVLVTSDGTRSAIERLAQSTSLAPDAAITVDEDDRVVDKWSEKNPSFAKATPQAIEDLFVALKYRRDRVWLDNALVTVSDEVSLLEGKIVKRPDGWSLQLLVPRRVSEVFQPGVARVDRVLMPQRGMQWLSNGRQMQQSFAHRAVLELVGSVIPRLEPDTKWVEVSSELPAVTEKLQPWVQFELSHMGRSVTVLPWVVYGDPPCGRIEGGRLVYLNGPIAKRREAQEVQLGHKLREELGLILGKAVSYEGDDVPKFLQRLKEFAGGQSTGLSRMTRGQLRPSLLVDGTKIELGFELFGGTNDPDASASSAHASAESVLTAWENGLDIVALDGGGFAPLPADWMRKHGALVVQLLAARESNGETSKAAAPVVQSLCDALDTPTPVEFSRLTPLWGALDRLPSAAIASEFTGSLRDYQKQGVDWLEFLRTADLGGILADDMGLGKTVQCLASMKGRTLVVCPRSVLHNWIDEAHRFRPDLRAATYHGESRVLDPSATLTVTTYAIMRMDIAELSQIEWDCVILDEAQQIKNSDSQAARAAFALKAKTRLALSGTPIENSLSELWSLMHFAVPGLLGGRANFDARVAKPIAEQRSKSTLDELKKRIRPFVLRRTKAQVLSELPPRTEHVLRCELDPHERAVYDAVRATKLADAISSLREGGTVMMALEVLLRLRQAACHPALVPGQRDPGESSKVLALMEGLQNAVGSSHKALVFSQWTSFLDLIEPHLKASDIRFTRLDGSTRDRGAVVKDFQSPDGPSVLLATLKAGGTGLNLTAADHVFILDPWWNPAAEQQAMDRAHRMGQANAVSVYRIIARDTVEEQILQLQSKKKALADAALDEQALGAALMRDDLLALLQSA